LSISARLITKSRVIIEKEVRSSLLFTDTLAVWTENGSRSEAHVKKNKGGAFRLLLRRKEKVILKKEGHILEQKSNESVQELSEEALQCATGGGGDQLGEMDFSGLSTGEKVTLGGAALVAAGGLGYGTFKTAKKILKVVK
jgi:hypothetical protein